MRKGRWEGKQEKKVERKKERETNICWVFYVRFFHNSINYVI